MHRVRAHGYISRNRADLWRLPPPSPACVCTGEITRSEFKELIASGAMAEIELDDLRATLEPKESDDVEDVLK